MSVLEAIILGIVQGLTEFLPISSSGHLVLAQEWLGVKEATLAFDTLLHIGTLFAVIAVFRKETVDLVFTSVKIFKHLVIKRSIKELWQNPIDRFTLLIITGTVPTALIGVLFEDTFEVMFKSMVWLGYGFIITGFLIWFAEKIPAPHKNIKEMSLTDSIIIGIAQGIAIIPSISRSGITIVGALFRGLNRELAARYSFVLSIPAILGAAVLQIKDLTGQGILQQAWIPYLAGTLSALVAGYLSVKFMIRIVVTGKFRFFAWYVWFLGAFILFNEYFFRIFG